MASIHEGHRQRLKTRFLEHGLESFSDIEALELLLFYALPRRNTNDIAHALLQQFGSFRSVMEADADALAQVPGVGESAAALICLVTAVNRRYLTAERQTGTAIRSSKDAGDYLMPYFTYLTEERLYALCLDSKGTVIRCQPLAEGMVNKVDFAAREIVDLALRTKAAAIILAHNHPSGTALPSTADVRTTQRLFQTLNTMGVLLQDHLIFCDNDYVSMRDSGCFSRF